MTVDRLKRRINQGAEDLKEVVNTINININMSRTQILLPQTCLTEIQNFDNIANKLLKVNEIIDSREEYLLLLQQMQSNREPENTIDCCGISVQFCVARLIVFQGYLATTWSVCDSVISAISRLLGVESVAKNTQKPLQITDILKRKENKGNYTCQYLTSFLFGESYGYPVGISYAIRNLFIHEAAMDFFEGTGSDSGFRISDNALQAIKSKLEKEYKVTKEQTRLTNFLLDDCQDDLLKLLKKCHQELDDALGCLVAWSTGAAKLQAQLLLERDRLD